MLLVEIIRLAFAAVFPEHTVNWLLLIGEICSLSLVSLFVFTQNMLLGRESRCQTKIRFVIRAMAIGQLLLSLVS